jgi:hypothetical protein
MYFVELQGHKLQARAPDRDAVAYFHDNYNKFRFYNCRKLIEQQNNPILLRKELESNSLLIFWSVQ